jgi:uncharacterized membrane protein YedE/YeeE
MSTRVAGGLIGLVFGFMLCWSGMTSPDVIRGALLFEQFYLFGFMFSAMATAMLGLALLRRRPRTALLTGEPIKWARERPKANHVTGGVLFGAGWGVANVCPGPVLTQLGQGIAWGLPTAAGVVIGVVVFNRQGARETEPAAEPMSSRLEPGLRST